MYATQNILTGAGAGLFASVVTAPIDKSMKYFVSERQKRKEKTVREGSPHEIAGVKFGERILHRNLNRREAQSAQLLFMVAYGVGWGLIYYGFRKAFPKISRFRGLPYALPFFLACDGIFAPRAQLSPRLKKIPWQFNVKEFANHAVWTAAAEIALRKVEGRKEQRNSTPRAAGTDSLPNLA